MHLCPELSAGIQVRENPHNGKLTAQGNAPDKLLGPLFLLGLVLVAAATINCGNSSSNSGKTTCRTPYNVVGDWTLNVSGSGGSVSGPGVINSSGLAVFFQTTNTVPAPGDTVVMPSITGSCSFSETATAYATPASGGNTATETVNGTIASNTSMSGTLSNGNSFSLAANAALNGPVTALSGATWIGEIEGATTQPLLWDVVLTRTGNAADMSLVATGVKADGSLCNMSGSFTEEAGNTTDLNVFDVSLTSLDVGCPIGGTVQGLGFESSSDYFAMNGSAAGTYLYAASSTSALVFEIFQPSGH